MISLVPILLLALACLPETPELTPEAEDWLVPASEVDSVLSVPCAGLEAEVGPIDVVVDEWSGMSLLVERDHGRVWIRDAFGVVSDRCWWLPESPTGEVLPDQDCVRSGLQSGQCTEQADAPDEFVFVTPGVASTNRALGDATALDGTLMVWSEGLLRRLDLTPSAHEPVDLLEEERTYRQWLPSLVPEDGGLAEGELASSRDALVGWNPDEGRLWVFSRDSARHTLASGRDRGAPEGPGAMHASGRYAAVATAEALILFWDLDGRPRRDRIEHPKLEEGVLDVLVHPEGEYTWVLLPDGVLEFKGAEAEQWSSTPGAQGLLLGQQGDEVVAMAWGNEDDRGVLYRLQPDGRSLAQHLDARLLGAGIGDTFQELVLVTEGSEGLVHVSGMIDTHLVDALPPGSVGLAMVAFAESPRDEMLHDEAEALSTAAALSICPGLSGDELLCCVHEARAARLEEQLEWLDRRLEPTWPGGPAAVVLGLNPSVFEPSRYCALADPMELSLPEILGSRMLDWSDREVGSSALFLHSAPYSPDSWWVGCPAVHPDEAGTECWQVEVSDQTYADFYQQLVDLSALEPWTGVEPDWTLLGGGYEGGNVPEVVGWPLVFPTLELPDGHTAEDGLFFGTAGMNPLVSPLATKELSPEDARLRPWSLPVGHPASQWDDAAGSSGGLYRPGLTSATPWLYESRRTGLVMADFLKWADPEADYTHELWRGDESPSIMDHADFALQEHNLVTRVLALKELGHQAEAVHRPGPPQLQQLVEGGEDVDIAGPPLGATGLEPRVLDGTDRAHH